MGSDIVNEALGGRTRRAWNSEEAIKAGPVAIKLVQIDVQTIGDKHISAALIKSVFAYEHCHVSETFLTIVKPVNVEDQTLALIGKRIAVSPDLSEAGLRPTVRSHDQHDGKD